MQVCDVAIKVRIGNLTCSRMQDALLSNSSSETDITKDFIFQYFKDNPVLTKVFVKDSNAGKTCE